MTFWEIIITAGIPSIICSALLSVFIKRWENRDKKRQEEAKKREDKRHKLDLLQTEGILAAMALGEATATALKNGHCNGETEEALKYEKKKKHEINDFLREQGVDSIE